MGLSVAFFGSGSFAAPIVELLRARGVLRLLVTRDEPSFWEARVGRGVLLSRVFNEGVAQRLAGGEGVDALITASYGLRLEREVLRYARLGSYNVHASLLPRWRGASPIQRAILHGDVESGVSVIRMDDRIDCGSVVLRKRTTLGVGETYDSLEGRLSRLAAEATFELLEGLSRGGLHEEEQQEEHACWAEKLHRKDGALDWRAPAERLERQVRAFSRWPGSFFVMDGERIVVHAARLEPLSASSAASTSMAAGRILRVAPHPVVACGEGEGALGLLRLQRAGRKVLDAEAFLRGFRIEAGASLSVSSCVRGDS